MDLSSLRTQYPEFHFTDIHTNWQENRCVITYTYQTGALSFHHSVTIPYTQKPDIDAQTALRSLLIVLGMLEGLNYWKLTASPLFKCDIAQLPQSFIQWFTDVLVQGMGEYFFVNDIDFTADSFITVSGQPKAVSLSSEITDANNANSNEANNILIALGGGKDSIVTLELLRKKYANEQLAVVLINPVQAARAVAKHSGLPVIEVARALDPQIFQLNTQGFLNGHVPISAIYSATLTLTAKLNGFDQVVVSNERSSNEESLIFHGQPINHQFSKSFAFEESWNRIAAQVLNQTPLYYSFVRPLYEIQIVKLFSQMPEYHQMFRSCNRGSKTNSWCGQCPKCLFAALLLHSFLSPQEVTPIFGKEILQDLGMQEYLNELTGLSPQKPLECVGTRQESSIACFLAAKQYQHHTGKLPKLLQDTLPRLLEHKSEAEWMVEAETVLASWNTQHLLPADQAGLLKAKLPLFPPARDEDSRNPLPLSGREPEGLPALPQVGSRRGGLLLWGFGREGKSSYHWLRSQFPDKEIWVHDDRDLSKDAAFQKLQATDAQLLWASSLDQLPTDSTFSVVKTPGIPLSHPGHQWCQAHQAQLTSNLQLFVDQLSAAQQQKTIAVTGTKGKSTTTSAIAHVLKETGFPVILGGNIGVPPLELLKQLDQKDTWIVLELSAHQLQDSTWSPHIAVLQAIVPEHLDYYPSFESYSQAKARITKFQTPNDYLIFNSDNETTKAIAQTSQAQKLSTSFTNKDATAFYEKYYGTDYIKLKYSLDYQMHIPLSNVKLVGAFNFYNLMPAIVIATLLDIQMTPIIDAIASFHPLPHRLEKVHISHGIEYVNDSLATTPEACAQAVSSFPENTVCLIAGGFDRHLDFTHLGPVLAEKKIKCLAYFEPTGLQILASIPNDFRSQLPTQSCETMAEAVEFCKQHATTGDTVLMSPASASFGRFRDYADRGEQFAVASKESTHVLSSNQ